MENFVNTKPRLIKNIKTHLKNFFTYNVEGKNPRVWELDLLRGILLLFITIDHVCIYAYAKHIVTYKTEFGKFIESFAPFYLNSAFRNGTQPFALWLICFMSGISCRFSSDNGKRLLKFWIFTIAYECGYAVLKLIFPSFISGWIIFNIIPVLTLSLTLWYLLDKIKGNTGKYIEVAFAVSLTVLGVTVYVINCINAGGIYIGDICRNGIVFDSKLLSLSFYSKSGFAISPDNFEPLLPHVGFFLAGSIFANFVYKTKSSLFKKKTPPKALTMLTLLGKHSLSAYLLLAPLIIALLWAITHVVWLFL